MHLKREGMLIIDAINDWLLVALPSVDQLTYAHHVVSTVEGIQEPILHLLPGIIGSRSKVYISVKCEAFKR